MTFKVAMPKGRIYKVASKLFREAGLPIPRISMIRAS